MVARGGSPAVGFADRALEFIGTWQAKPLPWRLLMAVLLVVASIALRAVLTDFPGARLVYVTTYPAIAVACLLGGIAAGLLATVVAAVLAQVLIYPTWN
ncbi:MAG TPA: hypothetical protein VII41_10590, partial [Steroidobacteraceae bacterium]